MLSAASSKRSITFVEELATRSTCSSLCLHPWNKRDPPPDYTAEAKKNANVLVLKTKIAAKKRSINEYSKLKAQLKAANLNIKDEVTGTEGGTHRSVTQLLEKFEKYSTASKVLSLKHVHDVDASQTDYDETKEMIGKDIQSKILRMRLELEAALKKVDGQLKVFSEDLQVLRTYKDKEYPVKALCISKLQSDVQNLSQDQKNEENDLGKIIIGERTHMSNNRQNNAQALVSDAAQSAYEDISSPALKQIAQCNIVLAHEIEINKREICTLENEISALAEEVARLSSMEATCMKKHVFPEAFLKKVKCDPDEDVVLDIPVQKFLPI